MAPDARLVLTKACGGVRDRFVSRVSGVGGWLQTPIGASDERFFMQRTPFEVSKVRISSPLKLWLMG